MELDYSAWSLLPWRAGEEGVKTAGLKVLTTFAVILRVEVSPGVNRPRLSPEPGSSWHLISRFPPNHWLVINLNNRNPINFPVLGFQLSHHIGRFSPRNAFELDVDLAGAPLSPAFDGKWKGRELVSQRATINQTIISSTAFFTPLFCEKLAFNYAITIGERESMIWWASRFLRGGLIWRLVTSSHIKMLSRW